MILNSPYISGSLTVTGNIISSGSITISGSIASASFATTSSFATTASYSVSSSYALSGSYSFNATTASNSLTASSADNFVVRQNVTASNMLATGRITAQTLVVQTVTSSIVYSSGSNIFGNLSTDVQQMTGSVRITGSLSTIGVACFSSTVCSNRVSTTDGSNVSTLENNFLRSTAGNFYFDACTVGGNFNFRTSNASALDSTALFICGGNSRVGIGTTSPSQKLEVYGSIAIGASGTNDIIWGTAGGIKLSRTNVGPEYALSQRWTGALAYIDIASSTQWNGGVTILPNGGGNVGIGTTSPNGKLDVSGSLGNFYVGTSGAELFFTRNENNDFLANAGSSAGIRLGAQSYLRFDTGTTLTERMRITSGGNIIVTNTTGLTTAAISTAGIFLGNTASTSGTSLFVKTDSVNTSLASGFGVNGTYAGGLSRIFLRAIGSISTGGYASAFSFMLDNNGTIRTAMQLDSDKVMRLYGPIDAVIPNADISVGSAHNLRWDGIAGFNATIINTGGQPYVNYAFNNGYISAPQNLNGSGNRLLYSDPNGIITNSSSDITLKKNVENITYGLSSIMCLRPVFYNWIPESLGEQKEIGFIAQEVQEIIPEVVGKNWNCTLSLDYPKLTAVLTKAIQELKCQNDIFKTCLGIG